MARTTEVEVKAIMDTDLADASVLVFINIATSMITSIVGGKGLSDAELTEMERWLSAHLIASTIERMGETEKIGEASIKYIGQFAKGFESTPYGQMLLALDTTGSFADLSMRKMSIKVITSFES